MKRILILSLLLLAMSVRAETVLTVEPISGAERQFFVSLIGNVRFANDCMYLYDALGNELGYTPLANIRKIVFEKPDSIGTGIYDVKQYIQVYPNPTKDFLILKGLEANQIVRLFSLKGQYLSAFQSDAEETKIEVDYLPNGTYLLQIGAELVKFIKQ